VNNLLVKRYFSFWFRCFRISTSSLQKDMTALLFTKCGEWRPVLLILKFDWLQEIELDTSVVVFLSNRSWPVYPLCTTKTSSEAYSILIATGDCFCVFTVVGNTQQKIVAKTAEVNNRLFNHAIIAYNDIYLLNLYLRCHGSFAVFVFCTLNIIVFVGRTCSVSCSWQLDKP